MVSIEWCSSIEWYSIVVVLTAVVLQGTWLGAALGHFLFLNQTLAKAREIVLSGGSASAKKYSQFI